MLCLDMTQIHKVIHANNEVDQIKEMTVNMLDYFLITSIYYLCLLVLCQFVHNTESWATTLWSFCHCVLGCITVMWGGKTVEMKLEMGKYKHCQHALLADSFSGFSHY